jgi:N-acetylglucosaminyldiphosphoundecaprenol N-acetyl-beta-D-mannosaminyltransferase
VDDRIAERRPVRVGVVNAAKLVKIERDPELARAVTTCELILADGMSVTWASQMLTGVQLERVAGIDLMEALVARASERGYRLYFLGATEEVLDRMLDVFLTRVPHLVVEGSHHGYFKREDETSLPDDPRSVPDILFVGMGTPAKEYWIDRNYVAAGAAVSMGVGGSFDVHAGLVRRAPVWMQRLGLEWFYRLLQEPRRLWRRYLTTSTIFLGEVFVRSVRRPFARSGKS